MYKLTHVQYFEALKENILKGLECLDCGTITVPQGRLRRLRLH